MKYLHTMVRVNNLDDSIDFYCNKLGLTQVGRYNNEAGRFTLVFLAAPGNAAQFVFGGSLLTVFAGGHDLDIPIPPDEVHDPFIDTNHIFAVMACGATDKAI